MHKKLLNLDLDDLISDIRKSKYQGNRCLAVVFERCIDEILINPTKALPLLVVMPDYVERCRPSLGKNYANCLTRAFSYIGSGLGLIGSNLADAAFQSARSVEGTDEMELAAVDCREAVVASAAGDDQRSVDLAEMAVKVFENRGRDGRDDCSLAFALVVRAAVRCNAFHHGLDIDMSQVVSDFSRALTVTRRPFKRTRLAAAAGLGTAAVHIWFSGRPANVAPTSVVEDLARFRAGLRRQRIPVSSVADAQARWVLGLAIWKLLGETLGPCAENHLRSARTDLFEAGRKREAAQLTLDLQWCLIHDGNWVKALKEFEVLEELAPYLDLPAATLAMWHDALRGCSLSIDVARRIMAFRGLKDVRLSSVPKDDPSPIGF